ncbi:60S acidic ribosomal protein P1-like protein [Aphelenchoides fujianensis]|nr:60S acidic ribosomal protein P1-like protein [Aphelenchoides fujianensis]
MASKQELAVVYAALILEDEGVPITAEKVTKLLQAAGVQVEPFWPGLYVKALEGVNVSLLDLKGDWWSRRFALDGPSSTSKRR